MAPFDSGFEDYLCVSLLFLLVSAVDNMAVVSPQLDDSFPKSDQAFDGPALTCVGSAVVELLLLIVSVLELDHGFSEVSVQDVLPSNVCLLLCAAGQGRFACCVWGPGRVAHGLKHRCVQKICHVVVAFHFVVQRDEIQLHVSSDVFLLRMGATREVAVVFAIMLAQHAVLGTVLAFAHSP